MESAVVGGAVENLHVIFLPVLFIMSGSGMQRELSSPRRELRIRWWE